MMGFTKSLYLNFRYLNFRDAIKFPIVVSHKVFIRNSKGKVIINSQVKTGMIKIGFGYVGTVDERKERTILELDGIVVFNGKCSIGSGSKICVMNGELSLGDNVHITANSTVICGKRIIIGNNSLISWDNLIMDTDFHKIKDINGNIINSDKDITIGKNVWIGCRCTILKGSRIGDYAVVAANTNLHSEIDGTNQVVGGNPVRVLKENIYWCV